MLVKSLSSFCLFFTLASCSSVYYNFWEALGQEKRDLLRSKFVSANSTQKEINEEFKDSLERMRKEYGFDSGELEKTYDKLSQDYDKFKAKSEKYSGEVNKSESIAADLFKEWEQEAASLSNQDYKKQSLEKLRATKNNFSSTIASMKKVESTLDSVLKKYHDQVIFIKHNLNAKMIGNLQGELRSIEKEIGLLRKEINQSTQKAESFIANIK